MRLCRYLSDNRARVGVFCDRYVVPLSELLIAMDQPMLASAIEPLDCVLPILPPVGSLWSAIANVEGQLNERLSKRGSSIPSISLEDIELLPPIARPNKLLLLAGNYVDHVKEQGDLAQERENTFPYVFSKPPSTSMIGSGATFCLPSISKTKIDYELELAVVIGKRCRDIVAADALSYVAGYTIINDISDRGFRPNANRVDRPRDKFFDWLHGKWHDGSCPCGPCITTSDSIPDPQSLAMRLSIDGEMRQDDTTEQQVFSVAEVIAFICSFLTLEPGDIISTGTPSGVGNSNGRYLSAGQRVEATIDGIGTLITTIK